jgi:hypothetical protein
MAPEPRGPREVSALPAAHLRELAIDVQMRVARAKEERRQRAPKSSAVRLRSKPRSAGRPTPLLLGLEHIKERLPDASAQGGSAGLRSQYPVTGRSQERLALATARVTPPTR